MFVLFKNINFTYHMFIMLMCDTFYNYPYMKNNIKNIVITNMNSAQNKMVHIQSIYESKLHIENETENVFIDIDNIMKHICIQSKLYNNVPSLRTNISLSSMTYDFDNYYEQIIKYINNELLQKNVSIITSNNQINNYITNNNIKINIINNYSHINDNKQNVLITTINSHRSFFVNLVNIKVLAIS